MVVNINPAMFHIGNFEIRWYALMYIIGLVIGFIYLNRRFRAKDFIDSVKPPADFEFEIIIAAAIGIIIGARLFYVLAYMPWSQIKSLVDIINTRAGGLSFHGGLIGAVLANWIWIKIRQRKYPSLSFLKLADVTMVIVPLGLFFGRLGNFINGELWGRASNVPWAMIFATDPTKTPRHPSQLYEALFEGLVLFLILFFAEKANRKTKKIHDGGILWLFVLLYGVIRFCLEFFREPDAQLGFILFKFITMGQLLCVLMILTGAIMLMLTQAGTIDRYIAGRSAKEAEMQKIREKEHIRKMIEDRKLNKKKKKRY